MDEGYVYLKVVGSRVYAYGDEESLNNAERRFKTGRLYDKAVSLDEWAAHGSVARIEEGGHIVLGYPEDIIFEQNAEIIRNERYLRLRACDKISPMRWNAMSEAQRADWTAYRQALLDIPQRPGFPWGGDISKAPWPAEPK